MSSKSHFLSLPDYGIFLPRHSMISIVGAGGKTTLLFWLAEVFKRTGLKVLATTTTHMRYPEKHQYDALVIEKDPEKRLKALQKINTPSITYCAGAYDPQNEKMVGIAPNELDKLAKSTLFNIIIVEADGAKNRPIKAPAEHEPAVPHLSNLVLGVISSEVLFKRIEPALVHRWEHFSQITDSTKDNYVIEDILLQLINHPNGLFKNSPKDSKRILVFGKSDQVSTHSALRELCQKLLTASPLLKTIWLFNKPKDLLINCQR